MKKALFFALIIGCFSFAKAQEISFIYNGVTYNNGDSITLYVAPNAHSFDELYFKNNGTSTATQIQVELTLLRNDSLNVWGLCSGDLCVLDLTSAPFNIEAGATYDLFSFDIRGAETEGNYADYQMIIYNDTAILHFVVGTPVSISPVATASQATAFPNPAQGLVSIRYAVDQPSTLVVYDAQGRTLRQIPVAGEGTLRLSDLPAGIYAYGILGTQMQKLIVR